MKKSLALTAIIAFLLTLVSLPVSAGVTPVWNGAESCADVTFSKENGYPAKRWGIMGMCLIGEFLTGAVRDPDLYVTSCNEFAVVGFADQDSEPIPAGTRITCLTTAGRDLQVQVLMYPLQVRNFLQQLQGALADEANQK